MSVFWEKSNLVVMCKYLIEPEWNLFTLTIFILEKMKTIEMNKGKLNYGPFK